MIKRTDNEMYQFQRRMSHEVLAIIEEMLNNPKLPVDIRDRAIRRLDIMKQEVVQFIGMPNPPYKAWVDGA